MTKHETPLIQEFCNCPLCAGAKVVNPTPTGTGPEANPIRGEVYYGVAGSGEEGDGLNGFSTARDALHTSGKTWGGTNGQAATITYSMALSTWNYGSESGGASNTALLSAAQQTAARAAFQQWSNVGNLTFVENNNLGNNTGIVLRQADMPSGIAGWASPWTSGNSIVKADILMDRTYEANPSIGTHAYTAFVHEIGHALGLSHPGNYNGANGSGGTTFYDNWDASLMSYYQGSFSNMNRSVPTGPMLYDIAAIQLLYGANTNYHTGADTYTLDGSRTAYAIWDAGGTDTLSAAGYGSTTTLDLREGLYNVSIVGNSSVWAAFNARIENATGGNAVDTIYGNSLANVLTGNLGNDILAGGTGNDTLAGGAGNDIYNIYTGEGVDTIIDSDGTGRVYYNSTQLAGTASLVSANAYTLTTTDASYNLNIVGSNAEISLGGANKIVLSNFTSGNLGILLQGAAGGGGGGGNVGGGGGGGNAVNLGNPSLNAPAGTALNGTSGVDRLTGSNNAEIAYGFAGADSFTANGGNDFLSGGDGADKLAGGEGNDTLLGGNDSDNISDDSGNNVATGDAGDDKIALTGTGNNWINGGAGADKLTSGDGNDTIIGGSENDGITSGAGNDVTTGDAGDDTIKLGDGNDYTDGGDGNDRISGEAGNDTLLGGAGDDAIADTLGTNSINGGDGNDVISSGEGNDTIDGGSGNDAIKAGIGNNSVLGGAGLDAITTADGTDYINGGTGDDQIKAGGGADTIYGGDDQDLIFGGADNDFIYGDAGFDTLQGELGNDSLSGGAGDDRLIGGGGDDTMTGGLGADVFDFKQGGHDVVTDFTSGMDLLDLSGNFAKILATATRDASGYHLHLSATNVIDLLGVTSLSIADFI